MNMMTTYQQVRPMKNRARAFTLIEVLIVLVIVLAIGGIVAVNLLPKRDQALADTQRVQLDSIDNALKYFNLDFGRYPTEDEGLTVLWDSSVIEDEADEAKWKKPYMESKNLTDQWGNEYGYRFPAEADEEMYELWSNGKDGEESTEDDIKARSYPGEGDDEGMGGFEDFGGSGGGG